MSTTASISPAYKRGPPCGIANHYPLLPVARRPRRPPPSAPSLSPSPLPDASRNFQSPAPPPPVTRRDVRPPDLAVPSGPAASRPPEPVRPRAPENPSVPRAPGPPRPPPARALARRRGGVGGGHGAGRAAVLAALGDGGRPAERQPRAPARPRGRGHVRGRAVARRVPRGAARWRAALVVPQHPLGPPALLGPARPLRPFPRPLPGGHAAGVRAQARPQPARRVHGHRHHHYDPAPAATHVMAFYGSGIGEWWLAY